LARRNKITKKELKQPDEFISFWSKTIDYVIEKQKQIFTGAVILVVLILAVVIYKAYANSQLEKATIKYAEAIKAYHQFDNLDKARKREEFQSAARDFEQLNKEFPRSIPGKMSLLYAANSYYNAEDFDRAIDLYKEFLQKIPADSSLRDVAIMSLGYCYETTGKFEAALDSFNLFVSHTRNNKLKEKARFDICRIYWLKGDLEQSLSLYEEFLKDYPDSFWLDEANFAINNIEYQFNSGIKSPEELERKTIKRNNLTMRLRRENKQWKSY
jgi:predicted negative regulator of RcsB-dependent stress response